MQVTVNFLKSDGLAWDEICNAPGIYMSSDTDTSRLIILERGEPLYCANGCLEIAEAYVWRKYTFIRTNEKLHMEFK